MHISLGMYTHTYTHRQVQEVGQGWWDVGVKGCVWCVVWWGGV